MGEEAPPWFANFLNQQEARMNEASNVVSTLTDEVRVLGARLVTTEQQALADRLNKSVKLLPPNLADPACWAVCDEYHVIRCARRR